MNLLTGLIDIENSLIYYLDYQCIYKYTQLSKKNNNFLKKHIVYKLLLEYHKNWYWRGLINWASANGHIEVLNWWSRNSLKLKYSENAIDCASVNGHIEVLNWWILSGLELKYSQYAIDWASNYGHINILNWWINSGLELKYSACAIYWACENNHKKVLEWWTCHAKTGCRSDSGKASGLELKLSQEAIDMAWNKFQFKF